MTALPPGDGPARNATPPATAVDRLRDLARDLEGVVLPAGQSTELAALLMRAELLLSPTVPVDPPPAVDEAEEGYLVTDQNGVILELNEAAAVLLRSRAAFLIGQPLTFLLAETHWATAYRVLARVPVGQSSLRDWQVRLRPRPPGEVVTLSLTMMPARVNGEVRLRWLVRSASRNNVLAERALEAERAFSDTLLDTAQLFALVVDSMGRIVRTNPYTRSATRLTDTDLIGKEWARALLPRDDQPRGREAVRRAAALGVYTTFTTGMAGAAAVVVWSVKAVQVGEGCPTFVLVLGHDVTELQAAQRRAVEVERLAALGHMTAALSHEGRNLLQSATACLERLSWRLEDQPEALDLVRRAQAAQRGLARLFEDVRTYAAPLVLDRTACVLPDIWREVWQEVRVQWPGRSASLRETVCPVPICMGDCFRLGQVFRNIMENSFASIDGPIEVHVCCQETMLEGRPALRVSIRDNGPGLSPEQRERIFEPFYTTKPTGTGLGMAIARRIMDSHGGRIAVGDATPGTELLLWLPRD